MPGRCSGLTDALCLSLVSWDYDRTKAIEAGRVKPEGIELNFWNLRFNLLTSNSMSQNCRFPPSRMC
ncbi:hypothetical protein C8F04DRAFT_1062258 [Mycena alexandri]|uniref:Uncharacterized protein n=1 Tax=Mycena alexandri TaxID=1745969 RepID=A0AAD6THZ3_9AGAR|nr:hypothetical protein C8F04DRAFT_1062258 [Mycena alexandri]